jgi:hypothetical protein
MSDVKRVPMMRETASDHEVLIVIAKERCDRPMAQLAAWFEGDDKHRPQQQGMIRRAAAPQSGLPAERLPKHRRRAAPSSREWSHESGEEATLVGQCPPEAPVPRRARSHRTRPKPCQWCPFQTNKSDLPFPRRTERGNRPLPMSTLASGLLTAVWLSAPCRMIRFQAIAAHDHPTHPLG